jgi:hypothetical protein
MHIHRAYHFFRLSELNSDTVVNLSTHKTRKPVSPGLTAQAGALLRCLCRAAVRPRGHTTAHRAARHAGVMRNSSSSHGARTLWLLLLRAMCSLPATCASKQPPLPPPTAHAFSLGEEAYPLARCLDGSAAAYYYSPGAERTKWLIFHEGGGFCTDIDDCALRAQTYLGSTAGDAARMTLTDPYFSLDPDANPLLHNFSKVYVRYCDGAYYSGDRRQPLRVNGSRELYFRGRFISEALIQDLATRHGLGDATSVVMSGCSAGAIRIFAHIDQLAALLRGVAPSLRRVVGFPDSGFYMDLDIFTPLKHFVVAPSGQNATAVRSAPPPQSTPPTQPCPTPFWLLRNAHCGSCSRRRAPRGTRARRRSA